MDKSRGHRGLGEGARRRWLPIIRPDARMRRTVALCVVASAANCYCLHTPVPHLSQVYFYNGASGTSQWQPPKARPFFPAHLSHVTVSLGDVQQRDAPWRAGRATGRWCVTAWLSCGALLLPPVCGTTGVGPSRGSQTVCSGRRGAPPSSAGTDAQQSRGRAGGLEGRGAVTHWPWAP